MSSYTYYYRINDSLQIVEDFKSYIESEGQLENNYNIEVKTLKGYNAQNSSKDNLMDYNHRDSLTATPDTNFRYKTLRKYQWAEMQEQGRFARFNERKK